MSKVWKNMMKNIRRERLLSISNVFILTVTFIVLGGFVYIVAISQTALRYLENQAQISVFFKDDFTEPLILDYQKKLLEDKRVAEARYVSKEEAFKTFSEINKDEPMLLESISASILPASLEIKAKNIRDLSALSAEASKLDGVEEVRYFEDVIGRFKTWSSIVYIIGFLLVVIFLTISYSVVIATLRSTIYSKGVELEILKLVGAANAYVKRPLLLQGILFGVISSSIAGVLVLLLGVLFTLGGLFTQGFTFGFTAGLYFSPFLFSVLLAFILVSSGALLGFLGSITAIKRYLKY